VLNARAHQPEKFGWGGDEMLTGSAPVSVWPGPIQQQNPRCLITATRSNLRPVRGGGSAGIGAGGVLVVTGELVEQTHGLL